MNAIRAIPQFFRHYAQASKNRLRQQVVEGKADPFFKFFVVVGAVGYGMTWGVVTRHRVAEKQDVCHEAMKNIAHH